MPVRRWILAACLLCVIAAPGARAGQATQVVQAEGLRITVQPAPAWTALFKRYEGWTGGDGIYAIPLSGFEGPGRAGQSRTMFVFGDSFVGRVDPKTLRRHDCCFINNSIAFLDGAAPDPDRLRFVWGKDAKDRPRAPFTPVKEKSYYWLQDGARIGQAIYLFPMRVEHDPTGGKGFQFKTTGVDLIRVPLGADGPDLKGYTRKPTPLHHKDERRNLCFGAAVMPNTQQAGAPDCDGYVYIYGRYGVRGAFGIQLAVARVRPASIGDFAAWRYWDGAGWSPQIARTAPLGLGGPELSVTPVASGPLKGKFLLVSMHIERELYIRIGSSPVGPFGPRINVYSTPEAGTGKGIYTYNAKAHPNLSTPGEWLISYNVNSTDWGENLGNGDIYRPRFLKLRFQEIQPPKQP